MRTISRSGTKLIGATLLCGVFFVSGCTPQYANHGYVPPQEDLDQIVVGKDTRDSVGETVGVPASSGLLTESGYYYVKSRKRALAFLAPREIDRQVVAISFDGRGVVNNVERFGLEKGQVVPLERRVTSSAVGNKTFLRQLLGNIGRFSPSAFGG